MPRPPDAHAGYAARYRVGPLSARPPALCATERVTGQRRHRLLLHGPRKPTSSTDDVRRPAAGSLGAEPDACGPRTRPAEPRQQGTGSKHGPSPKTTAPWVPRRNKRRDVRIIAGKHETGDATLLPIANWQGRKTRRSRLSLSRWRDGCVVQMATDDESHAASWPIPLDADRARLSRTLSGRTKAEARAAVNADVGTASSRTRAAGPPVGVTTRSAARELDGERVWMPREAGCRRALNWRGRQRCSRRRKRLRRARAAQRSKRFRRSQGTL